MDWDDRFIIHVYILLKPAWLPYNGVFVASTHKN
jgi:hypothetical protein